MRAWAVWQTPVRRWHRSAGFTLVEMMLAVAILAVIGSMSWMGLDALLRGRAQAAEHTQRQAQWQIAMGQWQTDLDWAVLPAELEPMGWDGKVFRLTRHAVHGEAGLTVVAWAVRHDGTQPQWMRWQSPAVRTVGDWRMAWERALQWGRGTGGEGAAVLVPVQAMDIHEWSDNAWVNGQSTRTGKASGRGLSRLLKARAVQPQGVRLMLQTPQGPVQKDWVSPLYGGARS